MRPARSDRPHWFPVGGVHSVLNSVQLDTCLSPGCLREVPQSLQGIPKKCDRLQYPHCLFYIRVCIRPARLSAIDNGTSFPAGRASCLSRSLPSNRCMAAAPPDHSHLAARLRQGDRAALARAITLVESTRADHRKEARALVSELLPFTGKAVRVGPTGVPGVGKSTLIDQLGTNLTASGRHVAVLAVDP